MISRKLFFEVAEKKGLTFEEALEYFHKHASHLGSEERLQKLSQLKEHGRHVLEMERNKEALQPA